MPGSNQPKTAQKWGRRQPCSHLVCNRNARGFPPGLKQFTNFCKSVGIECLSTKVPCKQDLSMPGKLLPGSYREVIPPLGNDAETAKRGPYHRPVLSQPLQLVCTLG